MSRDELMGLDEAAREARLHPATLRRRLRLLGAAIFLDPEDHRRRMVRRADLVQLMAPQPIRGEETRAA